MNETTLNLLWFFCGGFLLGLGWLIIGTAWCVSVVGIPVGVQCYKIAGVAMAPFGRTIDDESKDSVQKNLYYIWVITSGAFLVILASFIGAVWCASVVGIPFGMYCFQFAKMAICPMHLKVL